MQDDWYKYVFFFTGIFFLIASIVFHQKKKETPSIFLLVLSSFLIFLYGAFMFNFLSPWDERFHALVAKNMLFDPLKPTLYRDPVVLMEYNWWNIGHVWLHKQPLFMWQMALSMKLFGVNVYALRLPSVLLATLMVPATYRTGRILFNKNTGYISALLITSSNFLLLLISGYGQTDHNDVCFAAYISFSIWAWVEYERSSSKKWIILIGLFSGGAILTKWLVGLFIYLVWGMYTLFKDGFRPQKYLPLIISFTITVSVALPWQLYSTYKYPGVAAMEHRYNFEHLFVGVEGHEGSFFYHFTWINVLFGSLTAWILIPALFTFYHYCKNKKIASAFIFSLVFVYLFFGITATKMPTFTFILIVPVFLIVASFIQWMLQGVQQQLSGFKSAKIITAILLILLAGWRLDIIQLNRDHGFLSPLHECSDAFYRDAEIFRSLSLPPNSVLFNVKGHHYIEAMFHTDFPAYNFMPSKIQYDDLLKKDRTIVILKGAYDNIPDYLLNDPNIIILDKETAGCD